MEGYYTARVSSVNAEAGFVKVTYPQENNLVSGWLPLLSFEYDMPEIDSLVAVVIDSKGNGVVLGKIFSYKQPPEITSGYAKDIDGVMITKDGDTFEINFDGDAYIRYRNGVMTLKADKIEIDGYTPY